MLPRAPFVSGLLGFSATKNIVPQKILSRFNFQTLLTVKLHIFIWPPSLLQINCPNGFIHKHISCVKNELSRVLLHFELI